MEQQGIEKSKKVILKEETNYADGAIVSKILYKSGSGNLTLFAFDKGQELSEHSAPYDACVQVIDGIGEILINKVPFRLSEGEFIIMPANVPHAVRAVEKFKMLLTMLRG
ncbi:MAG: cupin domain-containing protein [Bacteroidales bacterium]